jgi:uncharacterized protein (DUF2164 family)
MTPAGRSPMTVKLVEETEKRLVASIKRFFDEEMDEPVGDLKAMRVLDFFVREVAPSVYNQAIADAQAYFTDRVADLSGTRYEAEFDYWKEGKVASSEAAPRDP